MVGLFTPLGLPLFHSLALVPFLVQLKPKIPFLGLSLLLNQTKMLATQAKRFVETRVAGERLTRAPALHNNRSNINARELFNWLKPVLKPVNHVSTSKILEASQENAQRRPQAACCRGFSTRQTSQAKDFVNAKSRAR